MKRLIDNYTVYVHICPNGKRYYGTTREQNPKIRWKNGRNYKSNKYFTEATEKYGWNNIEHLIIARGLTQDEAYWLEEELIKEFDTTNPDKGYNISKGGKSGFNGVKHTLEAKKKISEAKIGKQLSEDHKKKLSENHWDNSGENHPMYGKHHTEETRKKQSEANAKAVICITTKRVFHMAKEGAEYYNCNHSSIIQCCKGKCKSSGKYKGEKLVWRYLVWNHNKIYRIKRN